MKVIIRIINFIGNMNKWLGKILACGVIIIFLVVLKEVIGRYFFNHPTSWGNELTQMTFGVYVILSGGFVLNRGGHVNVDIIYSRFSLRTRAALDVFSSVMFFLFVGMMLWYGWMLAWESISVLEHSHSAWDPPLYPVKLMIPLGAVLILLEGIAKLLKDIIIAVTGEELFNYASGKGGAS